MKDRVALRKRFLRAKAVVLQRTMNMTPAKARYYARVAWDRTVKETQ